MQAKSLAILCLATLAFSATVPSHEPSTLTPEERAAMREISPSDLRARLSFLASDLLEGRDTPSPGLDIAAEYIASEFRRAGLEPGGNDGYFQIADFELLTPVKDGFSLRITTPNGVTSAAPNDVAFSTPHSIDLHNAPVVKLDISTPESVAKLKPEDLRDRLVLTQAPHRGLKGIDAAFQLIANSQPALLVLTGAGGMRISGNARLVDPAAPHGPIDFPPMLRTMSKDFSKLYDSLPNGVTSATADLHIAAPLSKPVQLKNVIGILRGSDPHLKKTCVIVTAHYDHIGMKPPSDKNSGDGDRIYNGANDDGSGADSVMELAKAIATLKPHPRRSIVFMTFFGEEKGELGSAYYGRHPVFPLENTVADLNLEQVGRTDSTNGPQVNTASLTGFGYSTVSDTLVRAGRLTGIRVYKDPTASDAYFSRSDNQALADLGVPAHTLCVAYDYPDYHGLGDEWPKIDYNNMARVDRMVAVALLMIANNPEPPHWNSREPKAARYLKAWDRVHEVSTR
jgi:hypothetical protein